MIFIYLALIIILLFFSFVYFLTKRFPTHYPKKIIFSKSSVLFFLLSLVVLFLLVASLTFSFSDTYSKDDIKCYKGSIVYNGNVSHYDVCPKILDNFTQSNFLNVSLVSFLIFIIVTFLFFNKNKQLFSVLFKNVDLIKEEKGQKINKTFLIIVISLAVILVAIGYLLLNSYMTS